MNKLYSLEELTTKQTAFDVTPKTVMQLISQLADTLRENERMREALKSYTYDDCIGTKKWNFGKTAREALRNKDTV